VAIRASINSRVVFSVAQIALLGGTAAAATLTGSAGEWHPVSLVVPLVLLSLAGEWFSVQIRGGEISASQIAIVLAMGLLGPVPAASCGMAAMAFSSAVRRVSGLRWISNLTSFAMVPFVGGTIVRALGGLHTGGSAHAVDTFTFGLILFAGFAVATALAFLLFSIMTSIDEGGSLARQVRELVPILPGELAAGALATSLAVAYRGVGAPALVAAFIVLLIMHRLTVALVRSEDRAEALLARSRQLVGLQLGVLRTLLRALAMRDQRTARHAATVAQYAKTLAAEIGCSEDEQEMVHTAGLLHDIGKFTWPDALLHADVIPEHDYATVRQHPQEGAVLVGALDSYGDVADAILYHHERVDGRGYPAGLIASEIPLGSRIIAICSSYDAMTARDSYRTPMAPEEAIEELRRSAQAGQLDGELVEKFIAVLGREGAMFAENADLETELDFERRVTQLARPQTSSPDSQLSVRRELITSLAQLGQRAVGRA
jgi:putative nucleotidyltransferase with HDIG domain